ncbi:MAG: SGNH/GDSL hydrolase family protein [Chloroflexi bacterium]|nr:SGNH/GDSL hydrolase family protein [Chloroflexota bacterium]
MQKTSKQRLIFLVIISTLLITSISINGFVYSQAKEFYLQLNATRLDPPGLSAYPTSAQQGIAEHDKATVIFFGDSRAAQWRTPDNIPHIQFINRGVGAQTSAQVQLRYDAHIRPLQPDILILQVGINDLKTIPLFPHAETHIIETTNDNIGWIVAAAMETDTTVLLTTIFPTGEIPLIRRPFWSDNIDPAIVDVNAYIHSLADENVIIFDSYALLSDENGRLAPEYAHDELHLTTVGYTHLNQQLEIQLNAILE